MRSTMPVCPPTYGWYQLRLVAAVAITLAMAGALSTHAAAELAQPRTSSVTTQMDEDECIAKGRAVLDSAMQRDPTKPVYSKERLQEAITVFQACLEKHPTSASAHYYLGDCYYNANDYDAAIKAYEQAARHAPKWYAPPYNLGMIYTFNQKNPSLAEKLLKKAIALNPDAYYIKVDLGRHYLYYRKMDKAVAALNEAFSVEKSLAVYHTLVAAEMPVQDRQRARKHYKRALVLYPGYKMARIGLEGLEKVDREKGIHTDR